MRIPAILLSISVLLSCNTGHDTPTDASAAPSPDALSTRLLELEQRLVKDPSNAELYAERARTYVAVDSAREAINDWKRAIALDTVNASYRAELGDLYYRKLMVDLARNELDKAIELDPDAVSPYLKLAEIELVLRNYGAALDLVNEGLRRDPSAAHGYYLKGWIYKEAGDTNLAISSYRTAAEQDPNDFDTYIQLGLLHAARHDDLAEQYYNSALEIRPNSVEALYNLAYFRQVHGMDSLALKGYERIMEIAPNNALAYYNSGWIRLVRLKDYRRAEKDLTRALDLETNYYQAWYNRGLALEQLGALDSAAADHQVALLIRPDYDPAAEALSRLADKGAYVKAFTKKR